MPRKRFNIDDFRHRANETLASSTGSADQRQGIMWAIEHVLLDTGNYRGFRYLTANEVPAGHVPGINISPIDGQHMEDHEARFTNTDRTRVSYFS